MDVFRRRFSGFLAASVLLPILPACSHRPPLRVGAHQWPGYAFMHLAQDEGWLNPQQVDLLETRSASDSLQLLANGALDAAALTLDEILLARDQGIPLVAALVCNISVGADKVISRRNQSIKALRGQRIGVETGALGQLVLSKTLEAAGLTHSDVDVIAVDATDPSLWRAGELDAMITYEPLASQLLREGAFEIYSSKAFPDRIFDLLAIRSDRLPEQAEALRHLISVHFRALTAFQTNPVDTAYRLARRLKVTGQAVPEFYRGLQIPDVAANFSYLNSPADRLTLTAQLLGELMIKNQQLKRMPDLQDLFTATYLPSRAS